MKTQEFFDLLKSHQDKYLLFEYTAGQLAGANYHITEVKHNTIESVDCGARMDAWNETIIQLWESPDELGKAEYMSVDKTLSILKRVGQMRSYDGIAEVKIEYGNDRFHTAQLFINDFELHGNDLLIKLAVEKTHCKANEDCGVKETAVVGEEESCCAPESGCC
ncbi:MAG: hypothetical protein DRI70_04535 [Bacteroidetes bacterium]|nr:MAG: hypothetical protein DRI70_04535 [Bacteroidota bacterium]